MKQAPSVRLVLALALLHGLGLAIFLRGFLLTRLELPNVSACNDKELGVADRDVDRAGCWAPAAFDRVAILVVDALRADFVFGRDGQPARMPKLLSLLDDAGPAGTSFTFVADTPTITMSRLKAILTGGLPTFLDIGQSFSAAAITEDNLLAAMQQQRMRVVVLGDDTWAQLAPPSSYAGCHVYPAFNVRDLHTVDDGVWQHIMPYLRRDDAPASSSTITSTASSSSSSAPNCSSSPADEHPAPGDGGAPPSHGSSHSSSSSGLPDGRRCAQPQDAPDPGRTGAGAAAADVNDSTSWDPGWEVLVGHYLGVDHAGHSHGGASAEMAAKLAQMDDRAAAVAEALLDGAHAGGPYSRTLLLVLGDHGQTMSGDHGGGSEDERCSALLAFNVGEWRRARELAASAGAAAASAAAGNGLPAAAPACRNAAEGEASDSGRADGGGGAPWGVAAARPAHGYPGAEVQPLPQIDLTPSLALLLGLPIPYGNLGKLNRRLWELGHPHRVAAPPAAAAAEAQAGTYARRGSRSSGSRGATVLPAAAPPRAASFLRALRANAVQVHRYLRAYAQRAGLPARDLARCGDLLRAAHEAHDTAAAALAATEGEARDGAEGAPAAASTGRANTKTVATAAAAAAEAEARYTVFLDASGDLARRKFARFDLRAMAAGAAALLASTALHAWLACRPCPRAALLRPASLAAGVVAVVHAAGLFSANWIQGEGRLVCGSLALIACLLWLRAALAMRRDAAPLPVAAAGGGAGCAGCRSEAATTEGAARTLGLVAASHTCAEHAAAATQNTHSHDLHPRRHQHQHLHQHQHQHGGHGESRRGVHGGAGAGAAATVQPLQRGSWQRRQVRLAAMLCAALACSAVLQQYGLIDRWGADPHDKRQLAAAADTALPPAMEAPGVSTARAHEASAANSSAPAGPAGSVTDPRHRRAASRALLRGLAETLLPLLLLRGALAALRPGSGGPAAGQPARTGRNGRNTMLGGWLRVRVEPLPFKLATAWWALQLFSRSSPVLSSLSILTMASALAAPLQPLLSAPAARALLAVLAAEARAVLLPLLRAARSAPGAAWMVAAVRGVLRLPLRLLLPRFLYGLAVLALLQLLLIRLRMQLAHSRWTRNQHSISAGRTGRRPRMEPDAVVAGTRRVIGAGPRSDAACGAPHNTPTCVEEDGDVGHAGQSPGRRARVAAAGVALAASADADAGDAGVLAAAAHFALSSCTAVLALLLGRRGPAMLLLLFTHGAALVGLLLAGCREDEHAPTDAAHGAAATGPDAAPAASEVEECPGRMERQREAEVPASVVEGGLAAGVLLTLLGAQAFFLTGHFCEFSGLQYDSPFVGYDEVDWLATPVLFWINSFGGPMLAALAVPLAAAAVDPGGGTDGGAGSGSGEGVEAVAAGGSVLLAALSLARTCCLCTAVLSAAIQREHVVVWALFAPKLVFEGCFWAAAHVALAVAALGLPPCCR